MEGTVNEPEQELRRWVCELWRASKGSGPCKSTAKHVGYGCGWNAPGDPLADVPPITQEVIDALAFYGDPDTWFAVAVFGDRPCGEITEDWSEHGDINYPEGDQRPGKRAREALASWIASGTGAASAPGA